MSPGVDRSLQLTDPFSSYTSSPTSPFSEPFPNPYHGAAHPFSMNETSESSPPPSPRPTNSASATIYNCSLQSQTFPTNLDPLSLPGLSCSAMDSLAGGAPHDPKYSSLSSKQDFANVYKDIGVQPSSHLYNETNKLTSSAASESLNFSNKNSSVHTIKEDETLKLLKKYYLEALLTQQIDSSSNILSERGEVKYFRNC